MAVRSRSPIERDVMMNGCILPLIMTRSVPIRIIQEHLVGLSLHVSHGGAAAAVIAVYELELQRKAFENYATKVSLISRNLFHLSQSFS